MVLPKPFLALHLETPKDVATKTGNARSFIVQTFTSIGRIVSPRYLSSNTKKTKNTAGDISDTTHTSIAFAG